MGAGRVLGGGLEWVFYVSSRRSAVPPAQPFSALPRGSQVRGDGGRRREEAGGGEKTCLRLSMSTSATQNMASAFDRALRRGEQGEFVGAVCKTEPAAFSEGEQQPKKNEKGVWGGCGRWAVGSRGRSAPRGWSWPGLSCRDSVRFYYLPPSASTASPLCAARNPPPASAGGRRGAEPATRSRSLRCDRESLCLSPLTPGSGDFGKLGLGHAASTYLFICCW